MPQKNVSHPLLKILSPVAQALIAIGTPPLFALKILLWTLVWFGQRVIDLTAATFSITRELLKTALWFAKICYEGFSELPFNLALPLGKKLDHLHKSVNFFRQQITPRFHQTTKWAKDLAIQISHRVKPLKVPVKIRPAVSPTQIQKEGTTFLKFRYFLAGVLAFFFLAFIPYWTYSQLTALPNPRILAARDIPLSTKIYDRNGILLYQFYADENRTLVKLQDLPKYVPEATIAIEDRNFYHHLGFDIAGIARAAIADTNGEPIQGGSTITQQLIKSALLTPAQTIDRKTKEIILSIWAETIFTKDQILEMYLNQVPYGSTAYGIDAAAETYFGKHAKDLTLAEAALLAGLPSAPTIYSPFGTHPELSKDRQRQVLNAMVDQGLITKFTAENTYKENLKFIPPETGIKAPHFVMYVKDYLVRQFGSRIVERGGLEVTTSLDYPTYETINKILKDGLDKQQNLNVGNAAALVTDPKTGEILAMVGSKDFFDLDHDGNVNVTLARRSPGSSIKPLNYALAFEKNLITPSTVIDDSPITYKIAGSPPYSPQNYDNRFHGKVTVRTALGSSYNVPAVKVLEKNGVGNFIDFAKKMGITTFTDPTRYGLSLTLGGGEVTVVDMATAYSAFANGGEKVNLNPIRKVTDYRGVILENNTAGGNGERVISGQTAFLINSILSDDSARAPTFGAGSVLNIRDHTVAVKTGTTETKRDNWTIGYSFGDQPRLVAVWVGNNDNSPMSPFLESGNTGAAAIWNPIMTSLLANQPNSDIPRPDNIIGIQVCVFGGLLPCDNCPATKTEYFTKGTEPTKACNFTPEEKDKLLHPESKPQ